MANGLNHAGKTLVTPVCIIGGGPAGATLARRLQQAGQSCILLEKHPFPRPHIGESLVNGILPLLDTLALREPVERAGFLRPTGAIVRWAAGITYRPGYGLPGFQVDRGRFDHLLLQAAAAAGAQVIQPAQVVHTARLATGDWQIGVRSPAGNFTVKAQFLVDATGRSGITAGRKQLLGTRTLALYAYWQGLPLTTPETRVEAAAQAWYWGAPLPDGRFNATVLIDAADYLAAVRAASTAANLYEKLLAASQLLAFCLRGTRQAVQVCDATAYYDNFPVTVDTIKIGDAVCAIDPLSSQGVQMALGSAIHAAAVINTILHRPADTTLAQDFYQQRQQQTRLVHAQAAAQFYREALPLYAGNFWQRRATLLPLSAITQQSVEAISLSAESLSTATGAAASTIAAATTMAPPPLTSAPAELAATPPLANRSTNRVATALPVAQWQPTTTLRLNPAAQFLSVPTLQEHWIVPATGISLPSLAAPVVYLAGVAIAELLRSLPPVITLAAVLQQWQPQLAATQSLKILHWLGEHDILRATN